MKWFAVKAYGAWVAGQWADHDTGVQYAVALREFPTWRGAIDWIDEQIRRYQEEPCS